MVSRLPVLILHVLQRLHYLVKRVAESFHEVANVLKHDNPGKVFLNVFQDLFMATPFVLFTLFQALIAERLAREASVEQVNRLCCGQEVMRCAVCEHLLHLEVGQNEFAQVSLQLTSEDMLCVPVQFSASKSSCVQPAANASFLHWRWQRIVAIRCMISVEPL